MTKTIKVYLSEEEVANLQSKAAEINIIGRAWLTRYLQALSKTDIAILDDNVKKILKSLNLK